MDIEKWICFFMWCTIINAIVMAFGITASVLVPDMAYHIQGQLFHISRERIDLSVYLFFAGYKILWLVFNLVPLMALLVVRKKYRVN